MQSPNSAKVDLFYSTTMDSSQTIDMSSSELTAHQFETFLPDLDGQLNDTVQDKSHLNTEDRSHLDEPILDTLMKDLAGVCHRVKIIALPLSSYDIYKVVLRGWELWGPMMMCTFLAFNLSHSEHPESHVAVVFNLVLFGFFVISLNYRVLSLSSPKDQEFPVDLLADSRQVPTGTASDQQAGDKQGTFRPDHRVLLSNNDKHFEPLNCPPTVFQLMSVFGYYLMAPCFCLILLKIFPFNRLLLERAIVGLLLGFVWPTFCSSRILMRYQHPDKRPLAIYPTGLFYFVLSCMIILNH